MWMSTDKESLSAPENNWPTLTAIEETRESFPFRNLKTISIADYYNQLLIQYNFLTIFSAKKLIH